MTQFDALAASLEARRRGLGPVAEAQFMFGAAQAYGEHVPAASVKFINRRSEGFTWAKRAMATVA